MQALMLAAGAGLRMGSAFNKCMVQINGCSLFEHTINALKCADISRMVVVTGYRAAELEEFMSTHVSDIKLSFIRNEEYEATNNIWSLYLAKEEFSRDDTILLESDLIYRKELLRTLARAPFKDAAVVSPLEKWMDGTTVMLEDGKIQRFLTKEERQSEDPSKLFKTVNIYKLSKGFIQSQYIPFLDTFIKDTGKNQYYEMALRELAATQSLALDAFILQDKWYEIDTPDDLQCARKLFEREGRTL